MQWVLYGMSGFWIVLGCCAILYTTETRSVYRHIAQTPGRKIMAVLVFVLGLLLVWAGSASHYPWFIRLLGLMAIAKGGVIFVNPGQFWDRISTWCIEELSDQAYRFSGIVNLVLGTAVLSWVI
ncbi:MAG: hypothetical protein JEZ11_22210 [Desulfobacterales bacterium]|nr:hypothetical protein [Desulfobacterales bacterium]